MSLIPQFLDIWGDSRQPVDAVHHAVLLNKLGAAFEDLGDCKQINKVTGLKTMLDLIRPTYPWLEGKIVQW